MKPEERVLCVHRAELPPAWLLENGALRLDERVFEEESRRWAMRFVRRGDAEECPTLKQLVPYCVATRSDGCVLAYPRHGSETRLHGLHSIGVGGHVNDGDLVPGDLYATLLRGAVREIEEELEAGVAGEPAFLGVLNEELTAAGGVHFGVVFSISLPDDFTPGLLPELAGGKFMEIDELASIHLEHWSRLALTLM